MRCHHWSCYVLRHASHKHLPDCHGASKSQIRSSILKDQEITVARIRQAKSVLWTCMTFNTKHNSFSFGGKCFSFCLPEWARGDQNLRSPLLPSCWKHTSARLCMSQNAFTTPFCSSTNYTNLDKYNFGMFCKIDCWAVTCNWTWMPTETHEKMMSFLDIRFITFSFNFEGFGIESTFFFYSHYTWFRPILY